jgi:hypothetical protein
MNGLYVFLSDVVVVIHLLFILFVVFGGLLALKSRIWIWIHLPAAIWGALIEFFSWICPLTPLENWLLQKAGLPTYETGFLGHYLLPLIYPQGTTAPLHIYLGIAVIVINLGVYLAVFRSYQTGSTPER